MSTLERIEQVEKILKEERKNATGKQLERIDAGLNWLDHKRETINLPRERGAGRDSGMEL